MDAYRVHQLAGEALNSRWFFYSGDVNIDDEFWLAVIDLAEAAMVTEGTP